MQSSPHLNNPTKFISITPEVVKLSAQSPHRTIDPPLLYGLHHECHDIRAYCSVCLEELILICRVKDYLEETNVQLGASYDIAKQSTESYARGLEAAAGFIGAASEEIGTINTQYLSLFKH